MICTCEHCKTTSSIFWWPITMGENTIRLCDKCMYKFIKWLKGVEE